MRGPLFAAVGIGVLLLGACAAITGAGDLYTRAADDGGVEGGRPGDPGTPTGDGGGGDALAPTVTASLARCGDTFEGACVPHTDGWRPILPADDGECRSRYPQLETYEIAEGRCSCTCAPVGGTCEGTVTLAQGAACGGAATGLGPLPGDGGCVATTFTPTPPVKVTLSGSTGPSSCTGTPDGDFGSVEEELFCSGATAIASPRCAPHEGCYPRASVSFFDAVICIAHAGDVPCPRSMPDRRVVASAINDKRSCGPCTCSPSSCAQGGRLYTYGTSTCTATQWNYSVDGQCSPGGPTQPVQSISYRAGAGCAVTTPPAVLGNLELSSPQTICCQEDD
jgi:hypothetical protein